MVGDDLWEEMSRDFAFVRNYQVFHGHKTNVGFIIHSTHQVIILLGLKL